MGFWLFLILLCIQINPLVVTQDAAPHSSVFLDHNTTLNIFPLPPSQATLQTVMQTNDLHIIALEKRPQDVATSHPSPALLSTYHHISGNAA